MIELLTPLHILFYIFATVAIAVLSMPPEKSIATSPWQQFRTPSSNSFASIDAMIISITTRMKNKNQSLG